MSFMVPALTPAEAIVEATSMVVFDGELGAPRGIPAAEIRYPTIMIEEPWQLPPVIPARKANWRIGALEACSLVGQVSNPDWLTDQVAAFKKFEEAGVFWGGYGSRVAGQLGLAFETLLEDRDSRQAVVTIFDGHRDLHRKTADVPCTIAVQFMIRQDRLEARTVMRSNDVWLGLTYDLVQFIALQGAMAAALDIPMGPYIHQPGSLHLYETDRQRAQHLGRDFPRQTHKPYERLFSGSSLSEISRTCRQIVTGPLEGGTPFERWLKEALS